MQHIVKLSVHIARCRTAGPCDRKQSCARWRAPVVPMGGMIDGMPPNHAGGYMACVAFVDVDVMDGAAPPRAVKPWPTSISTP